MPASRHILLLGATGLVGGEVLERLVAHPEVARITAPTRRPIPRPSKTVNPVIDFDRPPADADWWGADAAIHALGTTRAKAGSAAEFRRIDLDVALEAMRLIRKHDTPCMVITSSAGANARASSLYLRTKGELEQQAEALGFASLTIVRPGLILGPRTETKFGERLAGLALRTLGRLVPGDYRAVDAGHLADALVNAALCAPLGVTRVGSLGLQTP